MTGDRGGATVVMAGLMAVVIVSSVAVAGVGMLLAARAQAQNASDAGALAAAVATYLPAGGTDPVVSAGVVVSANGARLLGCRCPRDLSLAPRVVEVVAAVEVVVPVFGELVVRGTSRAEFDPRRWLGR